MTVESVSSDGNVNFAPIEALVEDMRAGRMVIMVDDEERENEGDLIMAAGLARAEDINYMARYGRGLICLTLTRERCQRLRLPLMVSATDYSHATNFTVSIEAADGITTGISAHDRARTVQAAVAPDAQPEDLSQPGHIFPVMAQDGGVLTRAGHTEAGCDLARLAGLEPAAVIVEVLNEDGTMARRPDLELFAREHGIRMGTIADLIRYRLDNEVNVECIDRRPVETAAGPFELVSYDDRINQTVHLALVHGDISGAAVPLVRVHLLEALGDAIGIRHPALGWRLADAMARIAREPAGIIVVLLDQESPRDLVRSMGALGARTDDLADRRATKGALRTYGVGAQILRDLGVHRMRVLSAPKQMHAISGFGLEIVDYVDDWGQDR